MNETSPSISPLTGGKLLSRDTSLLRGLSIKDRRNYIHICAASDSKGRFYRRTLDLGVDDLGVRRLANKGFLACYKHEEEDVGYIPGGESHSKYTYSPISTDPPQVERMPSTNRVFLHRDHRLLYRDLDSLETVVLHALINHSDSYGRGELCFKALFDIIGPCKRENDSRLKDTDLPVSAAKLSGMGRLNIYVAAGRLYYAALDAKQWAIRFLPASKIPPPPGEKWNYSLDSMDGLKWHDQRKETRKKQAEKRKATPTGSSRTGAAKRAMAGEASKEDLTHLFSRPPHKTFKPERSNAAVFAANILAGKVEYPIGELQVVLEILDKKGTAIEHEWFAEVTGKQVAEALGEAIERQSATMGAEIINNNKK